jgi:hypothetical protein
MDAGQVGLGQSFKTNFQTVDREFRLGPRPGVQQKTHPAKIVGLSPS